MRTSAPSVSGVLKRLRLGESGCAAAELRAESRRTTCYYLAGEKEGLISFEPRLNLDLAAALAAARPSAFRLPAAPSESPLARTTFLTLPTALSH